jgi:hypothetical protein
MPYRTPAIDEEAGLLAEEMQAFQRSVRRPFVSLRVALLLLGVVVLPMTFVVVFSTTRKFDMGQPHCHEIHVITVDSLGISATDRPKMVCD